MVRCKDDSLYVGVATNVEERIKRQNQGLGALFTAKRRPVTLIWKKQYPDQRAARNREREIKGWRREKKLELCRVGSNPSAAARLSG
jgi:putative endonuclease